jgi:hypothetical protein
VFGFSFDNLGGTTPEAIVTTGDSDGAAFVDGSLAGILVARWSYGGQASSISVFGNGTYAADLSYYRSQILAVTEQLACSDGIDDDGDGLVDVADPGCYEGGDPFETNALVACDDGIDNDGDGFVDWDGGAGGTPDPQCAGEGWRHEKNGTGCGIGFEVVLLTPLLARLVRR